LAKRRFYTRAADQCAVTCGLVTVQKIKIKKQKKRKLFDKTSEVFYEKRKRVK
jgi:hypothetical protein